ncbi:MAG TPA: helix-turn-helix domain-containing protein [Mycobacteriales bacterium]|nr:helix-turn-helix domain-containing protein [Mycobacteriales bacterium]
MLEIGNDQVRLHLTWSRDMSSKKRPGDGLGEGDAWLAAVATAAAKDSGAPVELLGEYLPMLAAATVSGRRPHARDLDAVGLIGRRAAEEGIPPGRVVDLYLSAAWRAWRQLPVVARSRDSEVVRGAAEAVLRVVDDAVAALVEGFQEARRQMIRREEALRQELVDDLLRGGADVAGLVERAEPFGIDLGRPHQVLIAAPASEDRTALEAAGLALERSMLDQFGDRNVLIASKEGRIVVLAPADDSGPRARSQARDVAGFVHSRLSDLRGGARWRVAAGRAYPGAYGIARSYEEARESLALSERLQSAAPIVRSRELLVYRVLARDHAAIVDLADTVLAPLRQARGGPEPLLETLEAYLAAGEVATEAARRLHLSVRAVTYRLGRIRELTGYDPAAPLDRLTLYNAVLGARLIGWPTESA